jgi:hypothetical protein
VAVRHGGVLTLGLSPRIEEIFMVTMKEMLEAHTHLKDQCAVWTNVINHLNRYGSQMGNKESIVDEGREVPEGVVDAIRDRIWENEVTPLQEKINELEGSTVEVKDGEGKKQVGGKKRGRAPRKGARANKDGAQPS